ncbi:GNAT family N-acetyltransferase [Phytoactinopolyspora halotolerans]|uniref:GNAT family N-acetyltransferase n=1 Tax=Phytoactinopolyspora halotolerans TaxID=1981512 RepID=A0A6L9SIL9_9ACTN|nr:GNAT family N-acetyltransferase [Phytoactinopolyspora halotolerans]NEE04528.1 GNAT family N-acetyltransferase [Phytoactinopolyspora halotolerans]
MNAAIPSLSIRAVVDRDADTVRTILSDSWGDTRVAGHGVLYDAAELPGYLALVGGEPAGLLTYHVSGDAWEVVTLDALVAGRGVGTALLRAVEHDARQAGARRLWLITTNENTHALRFYQRRGFDLVAVHRNAVTRSREELKPSIPLEADGILLRHELELERLLAG